MQTSQGEQEQPPSKDFVASLIVNFVEIPRWQIDKAHDKARDKGHGCEGKLIGKSDVGDKVFSPMR